MRRFVTLAVLLLFTIPFGVSISGCSKKSPTTFCNGGDNGIPVGQVTTIILSPQIFGISLNFAQMGQVSTPVATDCKGTTESVAKYTYGTFLANGTPDLTIADVEPTTGKLCAGTWNPWQLSRPSSKASGATSRTKLSPISACGPILSRECACWRSTTCRSTSVSNTGSCRE